jgi:hypothetical protein
MGAAAAPNSTELGLVQLAPRGLVEAIIRPLVPGADEGWRAAGVEEFLRTYLTPARRAAFYAAAGNIYLDEPHGNDGFWPRLAALQADALFVWGRQDRLVPIAFARHVSNAVPHARQLELDCGHVPQIERPAETTAAIAAFFARMSQKRSRLLATHNQPIRLERPMAIHLAYAHPDRHRPFQSPILPSGLCYLMTANFWCVGVARRPLRRSSHADSTRNSRAVLWSRAFGGRGGLKTPARLTCMWELSHIDPACR